MERVIVWTVRRYTKGSGQTWVWTSLALVGLRAVRSMTGRRELVEIGKAKPGQSIVIDHRTISHGKQMKQFKAEAKTAKREQKSAKREQKSTERELKAAAKTTKREQKAEKRQEKAAKRDEKAADKAARQAEQAAKATATAEKKATATAEKNARKAEPASTGRFRRRSADQAGKLDG